MTRLAVVILNFNGAHFLKQFLPNVIAYSKGMADIIVADNASTDNSVQVLKQDFPDVQVIVNEKNYGFAGGYNEALKHIDYEFFILLNSDVEVSLNWIAPFINLFDTDKSIAAIQPKLLDYNKKSFFEYAGAAGGFLDMYAYPLARGRIFDVCESDNGQYNDVKEIFWATGACIAVRSAYFNAIQGFDADLFAHMEEIDLCWRLKNRGLKIMYQPQSTVYHVGGGTLNKINPRKTYLNFRNNLIITTKNYHYPYFWLILLLRLFLDGVAGFKFLLNGNGLHFVAVIKAHFSFYGTFFRSLNKRQLENRNILTKIKPKEMLFLLLPYRFYIKKQNTFEKLSS
jgi:GT2 family glycosyltransferase